MTSDARTLTRLHRQLTRLPAPARVEAILASPSPARSVRALSAQEFFLTLREAGLERAHPLLGYASRHQVDFLVDVEAWREGAFDGSSMAGLIESLELAGEEVIAHWLTEADEATVVLALSRLLRVYKADPSMDEDTLPDGRELSSLDGVYFMEPAEPCTPHAFLALWRGLQRVRLVSRDVYEALLEQVIWVIPAEQEENAWEQRASRLAEKGFPDLDEALEVWAAGPEDLAALQRRVIPLLEAGTADESVGHEPDAAWLPELAAPVSEVPALREALSGLDVETAERFFHDLVRLGNRFLIAGLEPLSELASHRHGLQQAAAHVHLGLQCLSGQGSLAGARASAQRLATLCRDVPVFDLAKAGTAAVNQRAARARKLADGWLSRVSHARERLDDSHADTLEGLLAPRPAYGAGEGARPFRTVADLASADRDLDALEALGRFLEEHLALRPGKDLPELASPIPAHPDPEHVPWHAVALTALARMALGDSPRPKPFHAAEVARAVGALTRVLAESAGPSPVLARVGLDGARRWLEEVHRQQLATRDAARAPDPRYVSTLLCR